MSLVLELSHRYCNEFLLDSWIIDPDNPTRAGNISGFLDDGSVQVTVRGSERFVIPVNKFTDWSALKFPALGYRQVPDLGHILLISKTPSFRRGISTALATVSEIPQSSIISAATGKHWEDWLYGAEDNRLRDLVMLPRYTKKTDGMEGLMSGKLLQFVPSPDFAVTIEGSGATSWCIMHRRRVAGVFNTPDKIQFKNDIYSHLWNQVE